jgi:hypothetical protein
MYELNYKILPNNNLNNKLILYGIEIIDIIYTIFIYFFIAYTMSYYIDSFFTKLYGVDYKSKSVYILLLEVVVQVTAILIITFIGRNICPFIPFPLDGYNGYNHNILKELASGGPLNLFLMMFQYNMQNKLAFVKERIMDKHYG